MAAFVTIVSLTLLAVFAGLAARNGDERDAWKRRAEAAEAKCASKDEEIARLKALDLRRVEMLGDQMRNLNRLAEAGEAGRVPFADLAGDDDAA
jgi:hypothetical protein